MQTISPRTPASGLGRGGDVPQPPSGGDDDARNSNFPDYSARLRRARLGLLCAVVTVGMVFLCLTSVFFLRQHAPPLAATGSSQAAEWGQVQLPWLILGLNTFVLLLSSGTMELARRDIGRRTVLAPLRSIPGISLGAENGFPWLAVTASLGAVFLAGQWLAWGQLKARGFFVDTNPNSSFFYLLTAAHALHLTGGVGSLLWAWTTSRLRRPIEAQGIAVDVTAWYWHFMSLLWIYVLGLFWFAR